MRNKTTAAALLCLGAGLLLVGWSAGCGTAKAEPLDVTYYYLPG